jgi:hypothetical protein
MITTGSKWLYGASGLTFVLALAYGWTTGGTRLGPLSAGWYGAVGDHAGYGILLATSALLLLLGVVATGVRDADPAAVAQLIGADTPPEVTPAAVSFWPAITAVGLGIALLGLIISSFLFTAGLVVLGLAGLEWIVQAWADRATGDPEVNRQIRNRLMHPVEIPIGGALAVAVIVLAISRVFLAASASAAVWIAVVFAALVLAIGALVASKPRLSADAIAAILAVVAVVAIGAGITAAAIGERDFHHGEESEEEEAP